MKLALGCTVKSKDTGSTATVVAIFEDDEILVRYPEGDADSFMPEDVELVEFFDDSSEV